MAKVTLITPEPLPDVVLTMSREEAETLVSVLCRVGGNHESTRRGLSQGILNALRHMDVAGAGCGDLTGSIMFNTDPK